MTHDDTLKMFEEKLKRILNTWSNPDDRQVLFEQIAPLMFDAHTAYQNLLLERIEGLKKTEKACAYCLDTKWMKVSKMRGSGYNNKPCVWCREGSIMRDLENHDIRFSWRNFISSITP